MATQLPVPPFPSPDDVVLRGIVDLAGEALADGETDVRGALWYAAVHGWLEGHLEGEGCEASCTQDHRWLGLPYPDSRRPVTEPGCATEPFCP